MTRTLPRAFLLCGLLLLSACGPASPGTTPEPPTQPSPQPSPQPTPTTLLLLPVTDVAPSTVQYSNELAVDWITEPTPVSFSLGQLMINGLPIRPTGAFIFPGDRVSIAVEAPASFGSTVERTLTIGDRKGVFKVSTATSEATLPSSRTIHLRSFQPTPLDGRLLSGRVYHPPYRQPMTVTVTGGEVLVDDQQDGASSAVIDYGQSFRIRLKTPPQGETTVSATAEFNGATYSFSATTPRTHFNLPAPATLLSTRDEYLGEQNVADMNGDGVDDLVVLKRSPEFGSPYQLVATTYLNNGRGQFTPGSSCETPASTGPGHLLVRDLKGDRRPEILLVRNSGDAKVLQSRLSICTDATVSGISEELLQLPFQVDEFDIGDIDGDGRQDLVIIDSDRRLVWMKQTDNGFSGAQDIAYSVSDLLVTPLTLNDRADIVVSSCRIYSAPNGVPVLKTQTRQTTTSERFTPQSVSNWKRPHLYDMDGDGIRDLAAIGNAFEQSVETCFLDRSGTIIRRLKSEELKADSFGGGQPLRADADRFADVIMETAAKRISAENQDGISVFTRTPDEQFGYPAVDPYNGRSGIEYGMSALQYHGDVTAIVKGQFNQDQQEDVIVLAFTPQNYSAPHVPSELYAVSFLKK